MEIEGAVAFVTGGSGGLGNIVAAALARDGADVAIGYRAGRERAEKAAEAVTAAGRKAALIRLDQTDGASIDAAVADVIRQLGALDILINNAGMASGGRSLPQGDLEALIPAA